MHMYMVIQFNSFVYCPQSQQFALLFVSNLGFRVNILCLGLRYSFWGLGTKPIKVELQIQTYHLMLLLRLKLSRVGTYVTKKRKLI